MQSLHKFFSILLVFNIISVVIAVCAVTAETADSSIALQSNDNSYESYVVANSGITNRSEDTIEILGNSAVASDGAEISFGLYEGRENCLIWSNGSGKAEFTVYIPEDGIYSIGLNYYSVSGKGTQIEYSLLIDGIVPFDQCLSISFPKYYKYKNDEFLMDNNGNQMRPEHIDVPKWSFYPVLDGEGLYNEPYDFFLRAGTHSITLKAFRDPIVISSLVLYSPEKAISYEQYKSENTQDSANGEVIIIEAEKPYETTSSMLYPNADRSDAATYPQHPTKTRLNTIGGDNWRSRSQEITWQFETQDSGFYKIGFRYKQNYLRGMSCYREIKIDGKVPFGEFSGFGFDYTSKWALADSGEYGIYLEKGLHTITLTPTLSDTADIILRVNKCTEILTDMYSKIISITGTTPDMWRSYYLLDAIPELKGAFEQVRTELEQVADDMYKLTGTRGSEASLLDRISKQLTKFIKSQDAIAEQLESYHSNISSLSSWSLKLQDQQISLDRIYIVPEKFDFPEVKASFSKSLSFAVKSFVGAFLEDYSSIGNVYSDKNGATIKVWTAAGREQADIVKELIDTEFVKKSGTQVNLQLVQGSLETAVLSGRGPDVSLGASSPVSLALRGAVVPLDSFPDFTEIVSKYPETMLDSFSIKGHCYALPENVNFDMMFYRTDIFEELGLSVPETWDELYDVAEVLQRNNMNFGLPADLFQVLVLQMGGKIYNDSLTKTELTSPIAYKAFKMWTEFYSQYGAPIVKDDYNRFRTGELPLTIITYDFYMKLYATAPEIRNMWAMTEIPAVTKGENTAIITSTSAAIFESAENKDICWDFLKWWVSAETQQNYSSKIESVFGVAGRYSPADPTAYSQVAWSSSELDVLCRQWNKSVALPTVAGDYYVQRNITNAFESVLYNNKNPREALKYWMKQTDSEMARRSEEFGIGENS